jgi:hypothetical protein
MARSKLVWEASTTIMGNMMKSSGGQSLAVQGAEQGSRRKRGGPSDSNPAFVLAFADALRDILREEQRRFA